MCRWILPRSPLRQVKIASLNIRETKDGDEMHESAELKVIGRSSRLAEFKRRGVIAKLLMDAGLLMWVVPSELDR